LSVEEGDGEEVPCEMEVLRNDDERIFDWIDSDGCRPWPARGVSSRAASGSASGSGEVGAGGMGSAADSTDGSEVSCIASSSSGCSGIASAACSSRGFSSVSAGGSGSVSAAVVVISSVDSASLGASAPADFLLAFFFCFWRAATCTITRAWCQCLFPSVSTRAGQTHPLFGRGQLLGLGTRLVVSHNGINSRRGGNGGGDGV
jgi:hypothetical protein